MALPSVHPKAGVSTIEARLSTPVTSLQHTWLVTEQDAVLLPGRSSAEQDRGIAGCAHPDVQDELLAGRHLDAAFALSP